MRISDWSSDVCSSDLAEVVMRDAPTRLDGRRLGDQQARSRERELAEMGEVPVRGATILGAVFAHRRDDDAVGQGKATERDRREELAGHDGPSVRSEEHTSELQSLMRNPYAVFCL